MTTRPTDPAYGLGYEALAERRPLVAGYRARERRWDCLWCGRLMRGANMARHVETHWCARCERYHTQRGLALMHGPPREREDPFPHG